MADSTTTSVYEEPSPGLLEAVGTSDGQTVAVVSQSIAAGGSVGCFDSAHAAVLSEATMHTVALANDRHVNVTGNARFVQHSCSPNTRIVAVQRQQQGGSGFVEQRDAALVTALLLVAVRDIAKGETVSFDYCQSEYTMAAPFTCACGSDSCRGRVAGFSALPADAQAAMEPSVTPFVRAMHNAKA